MLEAGAELSEQGLQNLRTLTFGFLDAKAVADALRKLDLAGLPVSRSPNRQLACYTCRWHENEALVLYGAQWKTWSTNRDQKREQRKDRQLTDRVTMAHESSGSERKS